MTDVQRLLGVSVLVTRPRERAQALCFLLEDEGAQVLSLPLLELVPPDDVRPLRAACEQLHLYRWILLASPSGVHGLLDVVREAGTLDKLKQVKLATVGAATSAALETYGLKPTVQAETATGLGLYEAVKSDLLAGDEVLLPSAQESRRELEDALVEAGAHVTRVAAYKSVPVPLPPDVLTALRRTPPQLTLFASPRTFEAFLAAAPDFALELLGTTKVVAIGPTTAAALRQRQVKVETIAENPSPEAFVDAAVRAVRGGAS